MVNGGNGLNGFDPLYPSRRTPVWAFNLLTAQSVDSLDRLLRQTFHRLGLFISTFSTFKKFALRFACFLHQEFGAAVGTGLVYGFIPAGEFALGVIRAAIEDSSTFALSFDQIPITTFFWTADPDGKRSSEFAFRIF